MFEILKTEQCYEADRLTIESDKNLAQLMETAGKKIADSIKSKFKPCNVLVLCGLGNNGGDAFVVAKYLKEYNFNIKIQALKETQNNEVAQKNREAYEKECNKDECKKEIIEFGNTESIDWADIIIDGIFGAGLDKDLNDPIFSLIDYIENFQKNKNHKKKIIISIDLPTGISGNSGLVMLKAIKADYTYTFFRKKPAHLILPGKEYCGKVIVLDIGISSTVLKNIEDIKIQENHKELWKDYIRKQKISDNKYTRGLVSINSGNMHGATVLAAKSARKTGAGFVEILTSTKNHDVIANHCVGEVLRIVDNRARFKALLEEPTRKTFLIGCGNGINVITRERVLSILDSGKNIIIDADAISVFRENPKELFKAIKENNEMSGSCLLTPHMGEFSRIFKYDKNDKIQSIFNASQESGAVVLLKGNDTIIASAQRNKIIINNNATPSLATAGTGDSLSGIISALVSQGTPIFEAACAGTWIHGECSRNIGFGLIAEDIAKEIPRVVKKLFRK